MVKKDINKELERLKAEKNELERINKEIDGRVLELYMLYNVSKILNLSLNIEEIFNGIINIIGKTIHIDEFCIMLLDEATQKLVVRAWYPNSGTLPDMSFDIGEGISGTVAKTGNAMLIQDTRKEPNFMFYKGVKMDIGAFMSIPLTGKKGDVLGVFNIHKKEPFSFTENDRKFFQEVANQIAIAVENAIIYDRAREASMHDELTGLYNRRYFFEYIEKELARANRYKKSFSILMIDIDSFKNFNDKNGHLKGDKVLKETAKLFVSNLRASDVVVRFGGEEFICLIPETPKEIAVTTAEKLRRAVEENIYKGGENQPGGKVTITIGVATWPDDAQSAIELIDYADKAMYLGKCKGKNIVFPLVK
ncbi:MAG: hypothetical protein A2073_08290 [Deltaproteobacteria bacterium GWC2_42_11]|nr:MAG: hypothetical protein A2073_08290 [Deltaproteobacteria bacterium GWC2_42_11]